MFNLGMMEIVVVLAVAFLVVGPKDLPKVARWIARQIKALKKLIREIKKETGWDEFAKDLQETEAEVKSVMKDADIRKEMQSSADELRATMEDVRREVDAVRKDVDSASDTLKKEIEA